MTTTTPNKTSLANMSPETTALVAEDIGMIVLNAALIRVFMDLSAEDTVKFESFLQTNPIPSALLNFLFEIHEDFGTILEEEAKALEESAKMVGVG